ncbi:MAG TPA: patatin-like phospholipase family protein [Actinomycetota bacterium]|nr:patatin-like phospholipase family protein [Actinomycetota bacterium]
MQPSDGVRRPKRSLILAGGGIKVAFQAGVLQVLLDEAGLEFDHADGASGGVFNLAMYCQGMSGSEIADNWTNMDPLRGVQPNWGAYLRGPYAESLFKLDRYRTNVFSDWGLDWDKIRASDRVATFNAYNFTRNELVVRTAGEVDVDFVSAAVALPMWFPPVIIDGDTYIDAVYISDANLEEAIRRGADELWIIWTVSRQAKWRNGFVANYFQIIETAANGHLRRVIERIEANNRAVESGESGEFGRRVEVKMLQAEVPLHYLINFSRDRLAEAVALGVRYAREWCRREGIPLSGERPIPPGLSSMSFTEEMKGYVGFGASDFASGEREGRDSGVAFMFHLTMEIEGVNRFVIDPEHEARATGWIGCEALGGRLPAEGTFNLFVQEGDDPGNLRMLYRIFFQDSAGHDLTLSGYKVVQNHRGLDAWRDTTTLYTKVLRGRVEANDEKGAEVVAAGILKIRPADFARQMTTFRATGPTARDKADALRRFGQMFLGRLWDVYEQGVLSSSPF